MSNRNATSSRVSPSSQPAFDWQKAFAQQETARIKGSLMFDEGAKITHEGDKTIVEGVCYVMPDENTQIETVPTPLSARLQGEAYSGLPTS